QKSVYDLATEQSTATAKVRGRAAEPYDVRIELNPEGGFASSCSCPAWRGADRHCKHVAALLVALRDRTRPPRTEGAMQPLHRPLGPREDRPGPDGLDEGAHRKHRKHRNRRDEVQMPREVVVVDRSGPRVVSTGVGATTVQAVSAGPAGEPRGGFQIWLP